jgi:hypothetical protein
MTVAKETAGYTATQILFVGLLVLLLALWRLAIRLLRGEPAPPPEENILLTWIAVATHFLLYLLIFGMPITGARAWYFDLGAMGEIHEFAEPVIIAVVGLHVSGRCGSISS